jgi:hypothetical protein
MSKGLLRTPFTALGLRDRQTFLEFSLALKKRKLKKGTNGRLCDHW